MSSTSPVSLESLFQEEIYEIDTPVLVVVADWQNVDEADRLLLSKILASVKLSLGAVRIMSASSFRLQDAQNLSPRYVVSFGCRLTDIDKKYEVCSIGTTRVVEADSLNTLDDQKKKNLWNALKQIFNG